ncbi:hypothetical protein D3C84_1031310 [compost metagenome]
MNGAGTAQLAIVKNEFNAALIHELMDQLRIKAHIGTVEQSFIDNERVAEPAVDMLGLNRLDD